MVQNPKEGLERGVWYHVANICHLNKKPKSTPFTEYDKDKLVSIPKDSLVMFVEYHPSNVRKCKLMFGEYSGWIFVDKNRYADHMHFFRKAKG